MRHNRFPVTRHSSLVTGLLVALLLLPASAVGQPEAGRLEVAVFMGNRSSSPLAEPRLGEVRARVGVTRAVVAGLRSSFFLTRRTAIDLMGDLSRTHAFATATDPLSGETLSVEGTRITVIGYQIGLTYHVLGRRAVPFVTGGLGGITHDQATDIIINERFPLRTRLTCGVGAGITFFLHPSFTVRGEFRDRLAVWGSRDIPLHNAELTVSVVLLLAGVEPSVKNGGR